MLLLKTITVFFFAGLCEIGGGYLIWLSVREGKPGWYAVVGSFVMVLYGFVATMQPQNFARVYATYGGFFIVSSLVWAYYFDGFLPDRYDVIGALIVLIGVVIIYYAPRSA